MTVSTNIAKKTYAGNGSTTAFDLGAGFIFFNSSELVVTVVDDTTGVETAKVITTDYTVSGGDGDTGTVTMVVAPATGETLVIQRVMPLTQGTDFVNNSASDAEVLEAALDKLVLGQQQLAEADGRTLKAPITEDSIGSLPAIDARKGKVLGFENSATAPPVAVDPIVAAGLTVASSGMLYNNALAEDGHLAFPATQNASADPNVIDDYEEGTWTPVITDGTNNATASAAVGMYTKIGNRVHINGRITLTSLGSVSGAARIVGLPFAAAGVTNAIASVNFGLAFGLAIAQYASVSGVITAGATTIFLYLWDATTGPTELQASEISADGDLWFSGSYRTA